MLVSDPQTAAQLVTRAGERLHFDDVGCLVEHVAARVGLVWVRDVRGQWVDAHRARYRGGESTPMGYGFVADERGSLDFTQLRREVAQRGIARSQP
jgi:copper chaperone NosL